MYLFRMCLLCLRKSKEIRGVGVKKVRVIVLVKVIRGWVWLVLVGLCKNYGFFLEGFRM